MSITETIPGQPSNWLSYQQLLDTDTHPVPEVLRRTQPIDLPPTEIPIERYVSHEFFDLEVRKLWRRVWQMACREEDIPNVGDNIVYDIAGMSFIVVRIAENRIKAFYNACLHRGRCYGNREVRAPLSSAVRSTVLRGISMAPSSTFHVNGIFLT